MSRRLAELRGTAGALARIGFMRLRGHNVAILAYMDTSRFHVRYVVLTGGAWLLRVPVVVELCELPWPLRSAGRRPWAAYVSPLALTSGAITISEFLTRWAKSEYRSRARPGHVAEVPILVDTDEVRPCNHRSRQKTALYAASSGYDEALSFVLAAMRHAWASEPHCRLVLTGVSSEELTRSLCRVHLTDNQRNLIDMTGMVPREELLRLYASSWVCLAPLSDDSRSRARFPTKIAEYSASGRPVVTSSVGEIERYFVDGSTAFMAPAGDAAAFGEKIVEALGDPGRAGEVGRRARELAVRAFDYRVAAEPLYATLTGTL